MKKNIRCLTLSLSPAIQKTLVFSQFFQGEVNRSSSYYIDAAGKAVNVCRVLSQGGMSASCLSIGGRENSRYFLELCKRDSLDVEIIETAGRIRTNSTLVESRDGRSTEVIVNEPESITPEEEDRVFQAFLKKLDQDYSGVVISGSLAKGFSPDFIPRIVKEIKTRGLVLFCDYHGESLINSFISDKIRPDYIKINEEELVNTFAKRLEASDSERAFLQGLSSEYKNTFIISRGAQRTWVSEKGQFLEWESKRIKAVNAIGCGDSMTAGLAQGILEGLSLEDSLTMGRDYATRNALSIHPGWIKEDMDD